MQFKKKKTESLILQQVTDTALIGVGKDIHQEKENKHNHCFHLALEA